MLTLFTLGWGFMHRHNLHLFQRRRQAVIAQDIQFTLQGEDEDTDEEKFPAKVSFQLDDNSTGPKLE